MRKYTPKEIRQLAGLTQEEMSTHLNLTRIGYRNKEAGKTEFTFKEIKKMCDLAKVDIMNVK